MGRTILGGGVWRRALVVVVGGLLAFASPAHATDKNQTHPQQQRQQPRRAPAPQVQRRPMMQPRSQMQRRPVMQPRSQMRNPQDRREQMERRNRGERRIEGRRQVRTDRGPALARRYRDGRFLRQAHGGQRLQMGRQYWHARGLSREESALRLRRFREERRLHPERYRDGGRHDDGKAQAADASSKESAVADQGDSASDRDASANDRGASDSGQDDAGAAPPPTLNDLVQALTGQPGGGGGAVQEAVSAPADTFKDADPDAVRSQLRQLWVQQ